MALMIGLVRCISLCIECIIFYNYYRRCSVSLSDINTGLVKLISIRLLSEYRIVH